MSAMIDGEPVELSVALCTCHGEAWLEAQLDSILSQTLQPSELIVGDDASKDGTFGILQAFSKRAPFPVHIARHEPALGVVDNFEVTLSRARGQYIALCDQDDLWLPDRLERSVSKVRQAEGDGSKPVLVHSDLVLIDADGRDMGEKFMEIRGLDGHPANPLCVLLRHNLVTGCTVTCNRALLEVARPFPERLVMHDWWLALVAATTGEIHFMDEPTVRYRQHGNNQVGASRFISRSGFLRALPSASSRRALADVFRQDLELASRFRDRLPDPVLEFIDAIPSGGRRLRKAAVGAGIQPQGWARRIRFFLETFTGGYRRYL